MYILEPYSSWSLLRWLFRSWSHTYAHTHSPFHITMLPSLFPFEGSTPPVKSGGRRTSQTASAQQVVVAEVESTGRRSSSSRSATRSTTRTPDRQTAEGDATHGRFTTTWSVRGRHCACAHMAYMRASRVAHRPYASIIIDCRNRILTLSVCWRMGVVNVKLFSVHF